MNYHYLAFFMGLFGSIHCVVMCGPLLFAAHGRGGFSWGSILNKVLYQSGRILMYALLGLLLGLFGTLAVMKGGQQFFSVGVGIVLVLMGLLFLLGKRTPTFAKLQARAVQPLAKLMGRWLYQPGGAFIAGTLNGLLPCGMVYMALVSAMSADSVWGGALFMLSFGLGTLPLLLVFSWVLHFPKLMLKQGFAKILPILYLVMGIWFILRGANLDIPYVSPLLQIEGAIHCI